MIDMCELILYIKEHLSMVTVNDLAEKFYYSADYINRVFKYKYNMSLRKYIISERIKLSEKFMNDGISAKKSGELSGFGNYSNFIRTYKKYRGITPCEYIRCNRK